MGSRDLRAVLRRDRTFGLWDADSGNLVGSYGDPTSLVQAAFRLGQANPNADPNDFRAVDDSASLTATAGPGLREALETHTPEVADGPFIAACTCGWRPTGIAAASDGGPEWVAHALAATEEPGLPAHGRCCECFDAPNMAAGHEHWGSEV